MIRGAFILIVGFGLGYAKCLSEQDEIRDAAMTFKQFLQDEMLKDDIERKKAADAAAEEEQTTPGKTLKDFNDEKIVEAEVLDENQGEIS